MKHYILIIILSLCVVACNSHSEHWQTITDMEVIIEERPDSVLNVLQEIDTDELVGDEERAKYALLLSMAMDKNYIDRTDDSQIRIAVDYYKNSDDKYHKMLSYYYLARVQFNNKEYSNSITNLLRAESEAIDLDDNFQLGLIYRLFGDIHAQIYNGVESLNYSQKSYEHFKKSGREEYSDWALWDIARAYHNCKDFDASIRTANEMIERGRLQQNETLITAGLKLIGLSYFASGQFDKSIDIYNQIIVDFPSFMTAEDYSNLGSSYIRVGNIDKARYYMDIVCSVDRTLKWLPYTVSKSTGDYKSALEALEAEYEYQDKIIKTIVSQNVTETVSSYREYERIVQEKELQHEKSTKTIIVVVFITIILMSYIIISLRLKGQRKEIENNMLLASNLRSLLHIKETEATSMQGIINSLFEQRFATIDKLSSDYYEYQGTANEKQKIYTNVMKLVSGLGSDKKTIKELEGFINNYKDNLMIRFREEFPEMKESDCLLYLYTVAGFSSRAISIFIGEKLEVVYNRKSRLKQKINRSTSPNAATFAQYL